MWSVVAIFFVVFHASDLLQEIANIIARDPYPYSQLVLALLIGMLIVACLVFSDIVRDDLGLNLKLGNATI
jgi:hypothetical protein